VTLQGQPRTRLEQVLAQRRLTVDEFRARYEEVSGEPLSARQAYRWVAGDLKEMPYRRSQAVLERMFGEPAARLIGPPYGITRGLMPLLPPTSPSAARGDARDDWQGQLIAMSAERARNFLSTAEATNVGSESLDQLADDVRRLARAYPLEPLETLLGDLVNAQSQAFTFLEGRQRPEQARDLYLMAGVVSGLMAKASHDLGAPHDALTQARTAYVCADNAGHDGLRAWTRGLQSLICYWSGRLDDSLRYAEQGVETAARNQGTSIVWLIASQARALAALGRMPEANAATARAADARDRVQPDELDSLGGLCTFTRPRQLYYAADTFRWGSSAEAESTERMALDALDAYQHASPADYAFSDEAGARCALAVARIERGQVDGAAEAMAPVLELPAGRRIHGIVSSVAYVHRVLVSIRSDARQAAQLGEEMHEFSTQRLALPR
jgi:hypothetical protein